jgi:hypothetical protein
LGAQANVLGDKTPKLQVNDERGVGERDGADEVLAVKPAAHAVVQAEPCSIVEPSEQDGLRAFAMPVGAAHGLGKQENEDGDKTPRLQLRRYACPTPDRDKVLC